MEIKLNGTPILLEQDTLSLEQLLQANGLDPQQPGIAVAVNQEVIPRSSWADLKVKTGDEIEVITARQGG